VNSAEDQLAFFVGLFMGSGVGHASILRR
jgi:hypothetical protein